MEIDCPKCKATLEIDDSLQGQTIECPGCGTSIFLTPTPKQTNAPKKKVILTGNRSRLSNRSVASPLSSGPVPTHLGWALFVTILGAGSLFGIIAIIFAAMASGANAKGDYPEAKSKAKTASIFAWIAFLIDLVAVLIIVGSVVLFSAAESARIREELPLRVTRDTIRSIEIAAATYEVRSGHYPKSISDLQTSIDGMNPLLNPNKPVIDGWGNPFQLRIVHGSFLEIRSAGKDGVMNTADDISNRGY